MDETSEVVSEEFNALKAIFEDDIEIDASNRSCSICIKRGHHDKNPAKLLVILHSDYPQSVPSFEINAPHLSALTKNETNLLLKNVAVENLGQPMIYACVDALRSKLDENSTTKFRGESEYESNFNAESEYEPNVANDQNLHIPNFVSGKPITDRKSTFQGHLAYPIFNEEQIPILLRNLKEENPKIQKAKRVVFAYRIIRGNAVIANCDDDGETRAGGRLLQLLTMMGVENALIVVSRWHGGIRLGNDRFKHYNNAARSLIEREGLLEKGLKI